jgi:hypothetical protein
MNNLKQYAGLLNDEAPENHFLAYITSGERDMLVEAGGKKTPTESGIFAYPPGYGGGGYQGGNNASDNATGGQGGSSGTGTDGQGSTGGGGDTPSPGDTGGEGGNNPQDNSTTQFNNSYNNNDDIDSTYTNTSFDVTPEPVEKSVGDKIMDYVKGGGMIGAAIRTIGGALGVAKENKYAGITGEDGYGEGDYISTQGDWAESKGFVDNADDYYDLDLEEQQDIDKQMYDAGIRSQAFNDLYEGDTSNVNNLTSTERDAVNSIIPDMAYEVGGTTAQPSMVNDYFANLNNTNLGISENYLNTYNTAKSKMANTLNMTPNTQQYGYGNSYNDTYSRSMNNSNVFYNYLNEQGLI